MNRNATSIGADGRARILFEPDNVSVEVLPGESVLNAANRAGVKIASSCGGRGICKSCVIRYVDGDAPKPSGQDGYFFSEDKLAKGWRRACETTPNQSSRVKVPKRARAEATRMFVAGGDIWVHPEPVLESIPVELTQPTLENNICDSQRLIGAVNQKREGACDAVDLQVLQSLPALIRQGTSNVRAVVRQNEMIGLLPENRHMLGVAIDLGTTNIALLLVDLRTGNTLASRGIENPQNRYGADIIARISHAKANPEVLLDMQRSTVAAINDAVMKMCREHALDAASVLDIVIAGNTAMHHVVLGLPLDKLGTAPFTAVARQVQDIRARDLGFDVGAGAYVHMMDNIAGFVGGDHSAMLLGIRADREERTVIALDIGTNTEISLIHKGHIVTLSSPSGPALEGGNITCGMRAAVGAVESIKVSEEGVQLKTIGDQLPVGICGSAVLDVVAEFYNAGAINFRGQISKESPFADQMDDTTLLRLSREDPDLVFTQQDVRNVQLAKGAIRAGIDLLLERRGLVSEDLDRIIIAGAFGVYIRLESAIAIGMLPNLPLNRFEQIGNAASIGAKLALVSGELRAQAIELAVASEHCEQAGSKSFMKRFMEQLHLPKY